MHRKEPRCRRGSSSGPCAVSVCEKMLVTPEVPAAEARPGSVPVWVEPDAMPDRTAATAAAAESPNLEPRRSVMEGTPGCNSGGRCEQRENFEHNYRFAAAEKCHSHF